MADYITRIRKPLCRKLKPYDTLETASAACVRLIYGHWVIVIESFQ